MDKTDRRIIKVLAAFTVMFLGLVVYLSYFQMFRAAQITQSSYNKRLTVNEESVLRGSILDRNGNVLAYSERNENGQKRLYPFGSLYSHVIGYSYREYGKTGIESSSNKDLLNIYQNPLEEIAQKITGPSENGNNVVLTIDHELQKAAEKQLAGRRGSVIAMNPKTGEIYAMVSKPDFNPATLKEDWASIVENEGSPLLNRSTMGLYTPGSVFKIITATAALENGVVMDYDCTGSITVDGYVLNDYDKKAHGHVDLQRALQFSCNSAFASIGLELGDDALREEAQKYMFNQNIPLELPTKNSIFQKGELSKAELAATSIGQGKLLVTPLNMLLAASAIANDGEMVRPHIVKDIVSPEGEILRSSRVQNLTAVTSPSIAQSIKDMMVQVVESGTGKNARISGVKVAGKTGTAENQTDKAHAWFVGFAPANDPSVAVVVVLENDGSTGGSSAAPVAREMISRTLSRIE